MSFILNELLELFKTTGFATITWQQCVMLGVACLLLYLALKKEFEPLLLVPIAFGMLLANLPVAGLMNGPTYETIIENGIQVTKMTDAGGLLHWLYQGVKLGIYPPLIFFGVGAMTDFAPLIANPKSILLGAAAQIGIFTTFIGA
jgi:oxaloacetate decarboxylase beta subunit